MTEEHSQVNRVERQVIGWWEIVGLTPAEHHGWIDACCKWASNGQDTNRYQIQSRAADTMRVPKCEGGGDGSERAEGRTEK